MPFPLASVSTPGGAGDDDSFVDITPTPPLPPEPPPSDQDGTQGQSDQQDQDNLTDLLGQHPDLRPQVERRFADIRSRASREVQAARSRLDALQRENDALRTLTQYMQQTRGRADQQQQPQPGQQAAPAPSEPSEVEVAEREYKRAREEGDVDAELSAMRKISVLRSRETFDRGVQDLQTRQQTRMSAEEEAASNILRRELYVAGILSEVADEQGRPKADSPFYNRLNEIYDRVVGQAPLTQDRARMVVDRAMEAYRSYQQDQAASRAGQARRQAGGFDATRGSGGARAPAQAGEGTAEAEKLFVRDPQTGDYKYVGDDFYPGGQARITDARKLKAYLKAMPNITAKIQERFESGWRPDFL